MSMLEVDCIVRATVLTNGGSLLLKYNEHEIYVDHAELFWPPMSQTLVASECFPVGSTTDVYIKGYMYPLRRVLGSIKRVDPEANPYRKMSRFEPGKVFRGRIGRLPSLDYLIVQLVDPYISGIIGMPFVKQRQEEIVPGSEMDVMIEQLDIHQELLEFRFA
jgi:hypothetical protein